MLTWLIDGNKIWSLFRAEEIGPYHAGLLRSPRNFSSPSSFIFSNFYPSYFLLLLLSSNLAPGGCRAEYKDLASKFIRIGIWLFFVPWFMLYFENPHLFNLFKSGLSISQIHIFQTRATYSTQPYLSWPSNFATLCGIHPTPNVFVQIANAVFQICTHINFFKLKDVLFKLQIVFSQRNKITVRICPNCIIYLFK